LVSKNIQTIYIFFISIGVHTFFVMWLQIIILHIVFLLIL